jgi:ATP-binding cassette subfamily B protein
MKKSLESTVSRKRQGDWSLYVRTLKQAKSCWPSLTGLFVLSMLSMPLGLLAPIPLKLAVDSVLGSQPLPGALAWILPGGANPDWVAALLLTTILIVVISVLSQLQGVATSLLGAYAGERMVLDFRARLFQHIQGLSVSYHDIKGTSDSIYRIQWDAAALQYITIDGLVPLLSSLLMLGGMIVVTARIDWQLSLVALLVSPVLFWLSKKYRPLLRDQAREVRKLESSALAVIQEVLTALRVVKAFGREEHERARYVHRSSEGMRARMQLAWAEGRYGLFMSATTALGTAAVLWVGMRHVREGSLTLGSLLLVMAYIAQLYEPLKTIGRKAASLQGHLASIERAFLLLDERPDVLERPGALPLRRAVGAVAYQGVGFGYSQRHSVLHDVSFVIPAGARVGVAGKTGAGKSTLVSLLARFYDPTEGKILLDGVDLRDYKLDDLRSQFAIVLQEPVLFSTSIAENIAYARVDATQDEIIVAAKLANAHDFITHLPDGYGTVVGERGMRLSGGERQRISLARAFLKDAPILILDEPTSSVDTGTETLIMEAMERLMKGRTTFIIAHRLNTLAHCDVRLEVQNGTTAFKGLSVEEGSKSNA